MTFFNLDIYIFMVTPTKSVYFTTDVTLWLSISTKPEGYSGFIQKLGHIQKLSIFHTIVLAFCTIMPCYEYADTQIGTYTCRVTVII